jgi:hypothetical protein
MRQANATAGQQEQQQQQQVECSWGEQWKCIRFVIWLPAATHTNTAAAAACAASASAAMVFTCICAAVLLQAMTHTVHKAYMSQQFDDSCLLCRPALLPVMPPAPDAHLRDPSCRRVKCCAYACCAYACNAYAVLHHPTAAAGTCCCCCCFQLRPCSHVFTTASPCLKSGQNIHTFTAHSQGRNSQPA